MVKKEFPKIHFYDQDLVSLYDETWVLIKDYWKKGTEENGLHARYFAHPESTRINQFDACFCSFFLVYSNRIYPVMSALDNFYLKQEESGAIRGEYRESDGKPVHSKDNPKGILPPLFAWAEFNIYHKLGVKKRIREVLPALEKYYRWLEENFKAPNGLYSVPLAATMMENSPREEMVYPIDSCTLHMCCSCCVAVVRTGQGPKEQNISFTDFLDKVQAGEVKEVNITGSEVHGLYQNPNMGLHTFVPANYPDLYNLLRDKKVNVTIKDTFFGKLDFDSA